MDILLTIIFVVPLLLLALAIHEFAHAYIADKLGDPTPKMMGRVTINPIKHLDPIGTSILIITLITTPFAFGWAKPVVFNPMNLKNPKRDTGFVALAGPASNIIMATISVLLLTFIPGVPLLQAIITQFLVLNVVLAVFNLIPIYPLDGFNIVSAILPYNLEVEYRQTAQYGQWILLLLIISGATGRIIGPVVQFVLNLINTII